MKLGKMWFDENIPISNEIKEKLKIQTIQEHDKEKDKRIAELEKEVENLKNDWAFKRAELNSANQNISILTQTKDSLERDKAVLEKALELACDKIFRDTCPSLKEFHNSKHETLSNYFIQQAEKELGDKE